jgi:hypothetical protein
MLRLGLSLAVSGATFATPAVAQRPVSLGLGGGVVLPTGKLKDAVDVGWRGLATIVISSPMQPLGLRLDVAYDRLAFKNEGDEEAEGNLSIGSATLNFTYRLPMTRSPFSPYIITGLGAYRSQCSGANTCQSTTKFGWNAGLGTKVNLLGLQTFVEARVNTAHGDMTSNRFIPLALGVVF